MKPIRFFALAMILSAAALATAPRLAAQDVDVIIDWGDWWSEPAQMISPADGATLNSTTVTFQWTQGVGVEEYWLTVGTAAGGYDLVGRSAGLATSMTVSKLPIDGRRLYVTLFSRIAGEWQSYAYSYSTAGAQQNAIARLTSPTPGSTLTSGSVLFQWSPVAAAQEYYLYAGTSSQGNDLFSQSTGLSTFSVVNLPQNGQRVYVTLWTRIAGSWQGLIYQFTAAGSTAGTGTGTGSSGSGSTGTGTGSNGGTSGNGNDGRTDMMLRFDGVNDVVIIPIDASETAYTVSIWFRTTNPDCGIFSAIGSGGHDRHIYLSKGSLRARVWSDETISTEGQNYADGNWHQVTHVFGGTAGAQKLYVDGQLRKTGTITQSAFHWQTQIAIGYSADGGRPFQGDIYDVRLWDDAATAEEIAALYRQTPRLDHSHLVGYWTFDEAAGSQEILNTAPRFSTVKGTLGDTPEASATDPQRVPYQ